MQKNSDRRYLVVKKFALSICFMIAMFALNVQDSYGSGGCVLDDIQKRVTVSLRDATLEQILIEIEQLEGMNARKKGRTITSALWTLARERTMLVMY